MRIYFKNGMTKRISNEIAEILNKRILDGCIGWQTFSDIATNKVVLIINLSEIVYID